MNPVREEILFGVWGEAEDQVWYPATCPILLPIWHKISTLVEQQVRDETRIKVTDKVYETR